jgi:serine/threonine protein phosphatase 1
MRRFVIGDIHGCAKALRTLIETIDPGAEDEVIFLGDYIDRGPDSRDVIQQVLELRHRCHVIPLRGNHEIMLLGVALGGLDDTVWLENGGIATVSSYGGSLTKIPPDHLEFFQKLEPYYETGDAIFVHAGYHHHKDMHEQDSATTYWNHLPVPLPPPHKSGKRVFVGHTPQPSGHVLDAGHVVCIDTYCFGGGYLTAFETQSCDVIQADRHGHLRRAPLQVLAARLQRVARLMSRLYRRPTQATGPASRSVDLPVLDLNDDQGPDIQISTD